MATQTDADKLAYVMTILKHTEMPKPNYNAVAVEVGINNANNAQKRFRAIVKGAGFDLVDGKVVNSDGGRPAPADLVSTPKKGRGKKADGEEPKKTSAKKATSGTSSKKRKLSSPAEDTASGGDDTTIKDEDKVNPDGATA